MNTKNKGNKAESVVLSEFIKLGIPVSIPFGDNEKYDLVIEIDGKFKSIQVKYGKIKKGCVTADLRHRIGKNRIKYETYTNKVDFIAIWCEENNKVYLININDFANKTHLQLRLINPKNNSCISKIFWAKDFEIISQDGAVVSSLRS